MLNKRVFSTIIFVFSVVSGQENSWRQRIDSINQKKWKAMAVDLDSLSSPKVIDLKISKKDSLVLKDNSSQNYEEIPVTPFFMMSQIQEPRWYFYGQNNLVFNQSSYSKWTTGGNNSVGIIAKVNYSLSYKNKKHFWDNNVKLGYGMLSSTNQKFRKTDDYIFFSSKYGYDLGKKYYLLTGIEFNTQFSAGYNYSSNKRTYQDRISEFMAPAYLNFGLGVLYNPKENFQISFSPVNTKFTFVLDELLQRKGKFGLERDGRSIRTEVGAVVSLDYRVKIYKDIFFTNQLHFFSNYMEHPERVDVAYSGLLTMKFNKFISTTLSLDLVYDHDQVKDLQVKQVLGVGLLYNVGLNNLEKNTKKDKVKIFLRK